MLATTSLLGVWEWQEHPESTLLMPVGRASCSGENISAANSTATITIARTVQTLRTCILISP